MLKRCSNCRHEKPRSEFNRRAKAKDGLQALCKECARAKVKIWRAENPERKAAANRAYKADNRHKVRAQRKKYYEENRETLAVKAKAWREANPDTWAELLRRRRMRLAAVESEPYLRSAVYERDGGRCRGCGLHIVPGETFHVDHIVPISLGGPDIFSNVQVMCPPCNLSKNARLEGQIHFAV